jgi:hypothetical protein
MSDLIFCLSIQTSVNWVVVLTLPMHELMVEDTRIFIEISRGHFLWNPTVEEQSAFLAKCTAAGCRRSRENGVYEGERNSKLESESLHFLWPVAALRRET